VATIFLVVAITGLCFHPFLIKRISKHISTHRYTIINLFKNAKS
jgi:hypothetical protein